VCTGAQDTWQFLTFEGKTCYFVGHLPPTHLAEEDKQT
jgi:hypothetical protein